MLAKLLRFIIGLFVTVILGLTFIGALFSTCVDKHAEKKAELGVPSSTKIRATSAVPSTRRSIGRWSRLGRQSRACRGPANIRMVRVGVFIPGGLPAF